MIVGTKQPTQNRSGRSRSGGDGGEPQGVSTSAQENCKYWLGDCFDLVEGDEGGSTPVAQEKTKLALGAHNAPIFEKGDRIM